MKAITKFSKILAGSAPLLLLAPEALAGMSVGTITHLNLSAVPALGGFGLLLLSGLLGVVSLRFLKTRETGRFVAIAALAGTVASAGGLNVINNAEAIAGGISLFGNQGDSVEIPFAGFHVVTNRSGGLRQIVDISLNEGCFLGLENGGANGGGLLNGGNGGKDNGGQFRGNCNDDPGTRLEVDDFCEILVCCGPNGGSNGGNGGCFVE